MQKILFKNYRNQVKKKGEREKEIVYGEVCYVNNQIVSMIVIMMYNKKKAKDTNIAHGTPLPFI